MNRKPILEERYTNGTDIVNFVVYKSTTGNGNDEVLQHKLFGTTETAHITLHPDGTINFRIKRSKTHLENIVKSNLRGFQPEVSQDLKTFLTKIRGQI